MKQGELPPPGRLATLDLPLTSWEEDGGSSAVVVELLAQHESEALADGKPSEKVPVKKRRKDVGKGQSLITEWSNTPLSS